MTIDRSLGPGLRLPPPVLYLVGLAVGIAVDYSWPLPLLAGLTRYVVASAIVIVSVLIMPPVLVRFRRAGTPFDVRKAASTLITDGPYRFSRNPAYLSLTLVYLGVGFFLNNGWVLILVIPVLLVMDLWVVRREESHLEAKFGDEYRKYKSEVRRWL
jgi:protein-S-isoprenylcysteine O-methyltransferase Ste14